MEKQRENTKNRTVVVARSQSKGTMLRHLVSFVRTHSAIRATMTGYKRKTHRLEALEIRGSM